MEHLTFFGQFLHHPFRISAVLPTGKRSAKAVAAQIPAGVRTIVEYGPGTGPVTQAILTCGKLPPDGLLILIERSPEMAAFLEKKFAGDPRVQVFCDSAENVQKILVTCGVSRADCVLASIPFSVIPESVRSSILSNTKSVLTENGVFIVFLYRKSVEGQLQRAFPAVKAMKVPVLCHLCVFL
ncbi:methyltransferase domain-containing protein [Candidatus Peregrinibacteria bacterium]|nr:methyltransferase domain-containing protein [Candidatus Peregrinibacteria bacterium]